MNRIESLGTDIVHTFDLRRPAFILREHRDDLSQSQHYLLHLQDKIPHAFLNWMITRFDQSPGAQDTLNLFRPKNLTLTDKLKRESEFFRRSRLIDISLRTYNGVKKGLTGIKGELGTSFHQIFHDISLSAHGWLHMRGIEDKLVQLLQNSPDYSLEWKSCFLATGFLSFHDISQVFNEKMHNDWKLDIDTKAGHVPLSAIMFACFGTEMIQKEMHVSEKKAKEIRNIAVYCFLCHDFNDNLKVINGIESAQQEKYQGKANAQTLAEAIKSGDIDMSTLSMQQILYWGLWKSRQNREKIDAYLQAKGEEPTNYGLYPDFENNPEFKKKLKEFESDSAPLFGSKLKPSQKKSMQNLATAMVFADYQEMVLPFDLSLARKFKVPRSYQERDWDNSHSKLYDDLSVLDEEKVSSDVDRCVYELLKLYELVEKSSLKDSKFALTSTRIHVWYGLRFLEKFGEEFMTGTFAPIERIYEDTEKNLITKLIRKFHLTTDNAAIFHWALLGSRQRQNLKINDLINSSPSMSHALAVTIKALDDLEADETKTIACILLKKENRGNSVPRTYTSAEIASFRERMGKAQLHFYNKSGITEEEKDLAQRALETGNTLPSFADTVHSVGELRGAKTMIRH